MSNEAKRVVIMRGVSGSGKSTMARFLARGGIIDGEFWLDNNVTYFGISGSHAADTALAAIHSTDQYFIEDGVYRFTPKRLGLNHNANYKAFRDSVDLGIPLVIVDNTNTREQEYRKYLECATNAGYWVSFHVMPHPTIKEATERNQHGVPADKIKEMINRFE